MIQTILRASSHMAGQVKRPNPKLLSRDEERSPLKYIINIFLSNSEYFIEKNLASRLEFGFPFLEDPNSYREVKLLVPKVPKSVAKYVLWRSFTFGVWPLV